MSAQAGAGSDGGARPASAAGPRGARAAGQPSPEAGVAGGPTRRAAPAARGRVAARPAAVARRARAPAPRAASGPAARAARRQPVPLPVVEVFGPTLQGEGLSIGRKTLFVRLAGCDWACSWCDTPYAWRAGAMAPPERLTPAAVLARLRALDPGCREVTLSGGNPALHDCGPLVDLLHRHGYRVHVETQGSRAPAWLAAVDHVTVSPKGPSSGMPADWDGLARTLALARRPELKVVVFDERDYAYAREVRKRHPAVPLVLQVGNRVGEDDAASLLQRLDWLAGLALRDGAMQGVRVLPQLHVLLWGNRRGV